jgi:hypothetical protein
MANPYNPPDASLNDAEAAKPYDEKYDGLRGWLILVALGIVVTPMLQFKHLVVSIRSLFFDGTWQIMTTPGTQAYEPYWAPILLTEVGFSLVSALASAVMIYLFFKKKSSFPKWFIWTRVAMLVYLLADTTIVHLLRPDLSVLDPETSKDFGRAAFAVCVWVPYMIFSKRVQSTFRH